MTNRFKNMLTTMRTSYRCFCISKNPSFKTLVFMGFFLALQTFVMFYNYHKTGTSERNRTFINRLEGCGFYPLSYGSKICYQ